MFCRVITSKYVCKDPTKLWPFEVLYFRYLILVLQCPLDGRMGMAEFSSQRLELIAAPSVEDLRTIIDSRYYSDRKRYI